MSVEDLAVAPSTTEGGFDQHQISLTGEQLDWAPHYSAWALVIECFGFSVAEVSKLASLRVLELRRPALTHVDLAPLVHLRQLVINRSDIKELPLEVAFLPQLETLHLTRCTRVRSLPDVNVCCVPEAKATHPMFPALKKLVLFGCSSLGQLPCWLPQAHALEELSIDAAPVLSFVDCDLSGLTSLSSLTLNSCSDLSQDVVDSTAHLDSLTELSLCSNYIRRLPAALLELPSLTTLDVSDTMLSVLV